MNRLHHVRKLLFNNSFLNKPKRNWTIGTALVTIGSGLVLSNFYYAGTSYCSGIERFFGTGAYYKKNNIILNSTKKTDEENTNGAVETNETTVTEIEQKHEVSDTLIEKVVEKVQFMDTSQPEALPTEVPYLIIGGGIAGLSAARAIRASDPYAKVLMVNAEPVRPGPHTDTYPPYRRILLSKYVWRRTEESLNKMLSPSGDVKSSSMLYVEPDSFFLEPTKLNQNVHGGVALLSGWSVTGMDPDSRVVTMEHSGGTDSPHRVRYQTCLLATGSKPRRLPHLERSDNDSQDLYKSGRVSYFRSLNDFRNLSEKVRQLQHGANKPGRIMVIGSGLLGSELTSSLSRIAHEHGNLEVIEVYREASHLRHVLPPVLSEYVSRNIAKMRHTTLQPLTEVISISQSEEKDHQGRLRVTAQSVSSAEEKHFETVDHVVIAAGVEPDTALADAACLELDPDNGGFLVNAELQAREGLFVAGDACSFFDPGLACRRRVEHWSHAEDSGSLAGHNMAAAVLCTRRDLGHELQLDRLDKDVLRPRAYHYQSSFGFKLSMFKMMDGIGRVDSSLETRVLLARELCEQHYEDEPGEQVPAEVDHKAENDEDMLDMPGVVLYLQRRRLVGVLLWNCDDEILLDTDMPSPLRSNVARRLLAQRPLLLPDDHEALKAVASQFDLGFRLNSEMRLLTKQQPEEIADQLEDVSDS